jgi:YVTN family beta-propeller protein
MKKQFNLFVALLVIIAGCTKDNPAVPPTELPPAVTGVFIVNEGGFQKSNASLSFYIPDSHKVYRDIFSAANNRVLGDIANDMVLYGNKGFIVVNNSHKIEVISLETYGSIGTLYLPGSSPYKMVIANQNKGYVTNYAANSVTVFNPGTLQVIKEIPVGKNPKGILLFNNRVYVCNSGDFSADSTVSVIDVTADSIVKTITVGVGPNDLGVDEDGDIFVRCYGYSDWSNPSNDIAGNIAVINTASNTVSGNIPVPLLTLGHPDKIVVSKKGYGYVLTASGVVKFDTKSNTIASNPIITRFGYGIAIDPVDEQIYLCDPKDFVNNGQILLYSKEGMLRDSVSVGIAPSTIAFKQ